MTITEDAIYFSFRRSQSVIRELRQPPAVDFFCILSFAFAQIFGQTVFISVKTLGSTNLLALRTPPPPPPRCVISLFIKGWWSDLS